MQTVAYAYANGDDLHFTEQLVALGKVGYDRLVVETTKKPDNSSEQQELGNLLGDLGVNDRIMIFDLKTLGKSLLQLAEFLTELSGKEIELQIVSTGNQGEDLNAAMFRQTIQTLAQLEKELIRARTMKGLAEARSEGRVGGRPKVDPKIIERIRFLHQNKRTLRQISEECNVSLGTAYKYSQS